MKRSEARSAAIESPQRLRELTADLKRLEAQLRLGGGSERIERQHQQGKLTARERVELLLDKDSYAQEIGLLVAWDQYEGGAPSAGVVTVVGRCISARWSWSPTTTVKCRIVVARDDQEDRFEPRRSPCARACRLSIWLILPASIFLTRVACFGQYAVPHASSITTRSCGAT
jgi:hypothetical protein